MIPLYILSAGEATRMFPFGTLLPKALLPFNGKPFIRSILAKIPSSFQPKVCCLENDQALFEWELRDLEIPLITTDTPQGTGGQFGNDMDEADIFGVWYGDCLAECNLQAAVDTMDEDSADAELIVCSVLPTEYGKVEIDRRDFLIYNFTEHAHLTQTFWTGIGVFKTGPILPYLKKGTDLAKDIFPKMINDGKKLHAIIEEDYLDIGTYASYMQARKRFEKRV
jgi:NDP-sugar pyrophosphorylase family protein